VVKKAIQKAPIGGDFVTQQILQYLNQQGVDLTPQCLIQMKQAVSSNQKPQYQRKDLTGITASFTNYHIQQMIHDFKETICNVAEAGFNERDLKRRPVKNYEFPTGFNTVFGIDRFKLVESLFQPGFVLNVF
jgi:actin-related protein